MTLARAIEIFVSIDSLVFYVGTILIALTHITWDITCPICDFNSMWITHRSILTLNSLGLKVNISIKGINQHWGLTCSIKSFEYFTFEKPTMSCAYLFSEKSTNNGNKPKRLMFNVFSAFIKFIYVFRHSNIHYCRQHLFNVIHVFTLLKGRELSWLYSYVLR